MADTEQKNETEVTAAAEQAAGAEDTAAESAPAGEEPTGEETAAAEAAAEDEEIASAEEPTEAPGPAADDAPAAEEAPVEAAGRTEEPVATAGPEEAPAAEEAAPGEAAAETGEPAADEPAATAEAPASEHTYDSLKGKTVAQLREIAEGVGDHDALHGYTTMHKEELLVALCTALGVEAHAHHEVVGIDKVAVKAKIRELKAQRAALIEAGDAKQLKIVRRRIRGLKRKIHKATV